MATIKPDLTRVWANGAPPANVVDPDTTIPGKVLSGWQAEVPPFEHFNFLQKWFTQGLAHFNEQGIGVWDTDTTYPVNGLAKGSDGVIYKAVLEQSNNNPVGDDGTNWGKQITDRVYGTIAEMVADKSLTLGEYVTWTGKTSSSDGKGTSGIVVANGTGPVDEGYIDLDNTLQVQSLTGKMSIGFDSIRGRRFFQIYNWVDDIQIVSFADGTASGDAHVMKLPPDIRRDSHALLCTAGTVGGQNDIDFRTSNFSDYAIINASSAYQAENLTLLFDTKPSRNDGTKKDGTGGGGLAPGDDVYAFDAAMSMPSNRTTDPLTFPALPVQFNQYVELRRRSTGTTYFRFTPNVDDVAITENASGNTLGKMEDDGITLGGQKSYASNITDIQAGNGSHKVSRNLSLGSASPRVYRLAASGQILAGTLRLMTAGSGGASTAGFRHIAFQSDGTTVTTQVIGVDNLEPQFHADLVINAGILDLELLYDGGLGGSGRFSFTVEWDSRSD